MADSVTVSLLPVSLSLVHIPRSRVHNLFHPILRQLLLPKPTFLNVTCNEIELSLFADHHALRDFKPVARHDAHKAKILGQERTYSEEEDIKRTMDWQDWSPVEVSQDRWNVLQIDSHSDGLDTSGARVHELSAPLAAAGISILYQSSYMSDFIFVKEHRLSEVMSLLGAAGFDLYSSDPEHLTSQLSTLTSPILSPLSKGVDDDSSIHLLDLSATGTPISTENGAVLTRSRSSTDASSASHTRKPSPQHDTHPEQHEHGSHPKHQLYRSQSHSPSGCDVQVLEPDLTCIGLSDDSADVWGLKIIKLVSFPDLISGPHVSSSSSPVHRRRSLTVSELFSVAGLGVTIEDPHDLSCEPEDMTSDDDRSDDTTRVGDSPIDPDFRASSESPIFEMEPPDTLDEDIAARDEQTAGDESMTSSVATVHAPIFEEAMNMSEVPQSPGRPILPHIDTDNAYTPSSPVRNRKHSQRSSSHSLVPPEPLVPFFSFTRTPEGSSLTAPVNLLASLFPPSERHMVNCSGELDVLDSRSGSPSGPRSAGEDEGQTSDQLAEVEGTLKCLQIDLRKFGLDKHGLVNRYSRTLEENGINHMYSSTYKTANLLVDKAHSRRAQMLLRSC